MLGALPMKVHFYSPVPDLIELAQRHIWDAKSSLEGIKFDVASQINLMNKLGNDFGHECNWPWSPTSDPSEFFLNSVSVSLGMPIIPLQKLCYGWLPMIIHANHSCV